MRLSCKFLRRVLLPTRATSVRLTANEDGAAAIEFAMIALPFLLFILGVIGYGLYFFTNSSLEYGVETAARKIRTGEINSAGAAREDNQMTVGEFRKLVCDSAGPAIDCSKLNVIVQHGDDWSEISPQACTDSKGAMSGATGQTGDILANYAGAASSVVLVTLCYEWDLAANFSLVKLGSRPDGSGPAILQAAAAFKSEPYN
ncbi:MAG: TadE/TadG family type IV pilus assembly protein [Hyphomicrobium sp.]|jgi:Flp pilus assembly protein TadG